MASITDAIASRNSLLNSVKKSGLNILFPKDFELYMCAFEIVNSDDKTEYYFIFPIMPSSINESKPYTNVVRKTAGGIVTLSNPTFDPVDISLSGNFGRNFKILIGNTIQDVVHGFVDYDISAGRLLKGQIPGFMPQVKTGYGCIKLLEDIIEYSKVVDENGPKRLIFYNLALGNNYYVKVQNLTFTQSQDNNMIWNYSIQMKGIAKIDNFKKEVVSERTTLNVGGFLQNQVNNVISNITEALI